MSSVMNWEKVWVQYFALIILVAGVFLALYSKGVIIGGIVMLLCGFIAGRVWYLKRYKEQILPYTLIFLGFIVGILIGSVWSSRILNIIMFALGGYASYTLHQKGFITFKSQNFIK